MEGGSTRQDSAGSKVERPRIAVRFDGRPLMRAVDTNILVHAHRQEPHEHAVAEKLDRKSTRLNSSHTVISYAVFCLKKKIITVKQIHPEPSTSHSSTRNHEHAEIISIAQK